MIDDTVDKIKVAAMVTLVVLITMEVYDVLNNIYRRRNHGRDIQELVTVEVEIDDNSISEEEMDIAEVRISGTF